MKIKLTLKQWSVPFGLVGILVGVIAIFEPMYGTAIGYTNFDMHLALILLTTALVLILVHNKIKDGVVYSDG